MVLDPITAISDLIKVGLDKFVMDKGQKEKLKAEDSKLGALGRKLKQAVANGDMTEDEAIAIMIQENRVAR